jgi:tetratricopeptide (TPR) repeat protein
MRWFLIFLTLLLSSAVYSADNKRVSIVKAQMKIEAGEYQAAIDFLANATQEHPSDVLFSLYGQALYENKQIVEAESQFRLALKINPLNNVARTYIERIRATNNAAVSEQAQLLEAISFDKIADLITMAFAFLLASVLNRYLMQFTQWRFSRKSKSLFIKGEYDDFTDLLEIQIANNALSMLAKSLNFMLQHKSSEEAIEMLELYVNTEENLQILKRMILQNVKRAARS